MPLTPPGVLGEIVEHKRREVEQARRAVSQSELEAMAARTEPPRNFFRAVTRHPDARHVAVIAEIKRRSPGAGWLRDEYADEGFDPQPIAQAYWRAGAAAISCLTDRHYFGGRLEYLQRVRQAVPLPVLRKDFIVDPWQLWESRAHGADAVLLIADVLTESELVDMLILAQQLRMTVLVEVHEMESLLRVVPHVGFPHPGYFLLGINNRDLRTLEVDLAHTLRLANVAGQMIHDCSILVSESGIRRRADLDRLRAADVRIALVGEHLMRQPDPGAALADLLRQAP